MPFVQAAGSLRTVSAAPVPHPFSMTIAPSLRQDYATIWRTQPAVRTVVDFLARNIAQLGLHVFRRASDTDRERLASHPMARLIANPAPADMKITRYRLIDALVHDLGIYDTACWLKVKADGTEKPGALLRVPPWMVEPIDGDWMAASQYRVRGNRGYRDFPADQVVFFRGYNPDDPRTGSPPIETLRRILAEEYAATVYRDQLWRNGARFAGYISRPVDAPVWGDTARNRFRASWQAQYTGDGPQAGGTPILEDGMEFVPAAVTPQQAQYLEARKLTREEVAAAYHIPLPMVGILDHATFSNITEQHKQLYQDTLGPWLTMIAEDLMLQLLPDLDDSVDVYVEFNIAEKLKGSFEEQASSIQSLVGRPVLTADEGRALLNRNALGGDAAQLVTPLNVLIGGQASPTDSAPDPVAANLAAMPDRAVKSVTVKARAPRTATTRTEQVLVGFFDRQAKALISKVGAEKAAFRKVAVDDVFNEDRWNGELSADLLRLNLLLAVAAGQATLEEIGEDPDELDKDRMVGWLTANAAGVAAGINATTKAAVAALLKDADPIGAIKALFDAYRSQRAPQIAHAQTSAMSGFGTVEAVRQVGGDGAVKTWVTGSNPRSTHARLDGETVGIDDLFSNGARWPGDSKLSENDRAGCNCSVTVSIESVSSSTA
jgi:HK97 family phage portal protein